MGCNKRIIGSAVAPTLSSGIVALARTLAIAVGALLPILLAACGSDQLTGSWRADGAKGGRQLIVATHDDSYYMALPGTGAWLFIMST